MEAGNRCKDECLPEETNRRIVDIISDVNLAYSEHARRYLAECGVPKERTYVTGSPMAEVLHQNLAEIEASDIHAVSYTHLVFTKLIDDSASTTHRLDSIKYNLEIFTKSPLWGSGLVKTNMLFSEMTKGSQTSTMTLYFAQFGLIGVVYMVAHFISVVKYSSWTKTMCVLFCIAWALLLNVEIVTFFPLIYIISFYFIKEGLLKQPSIEQEV